MADSTPFIGELRLISFNFPPKGWAFCNGQLLPINQNQPLFSLLGTTYGGDGRVNFALPDLRGRVPMHFGNSFTLGERAGEEFHTLIQSEMPIHNHLVKASSAQANIVTPVGNTWGMQPANPYSSASPDVALSPLSVGNGGGSQPHENRMPFLVVNFIIALVGIFPSQT